MLSMTIFRISNKQLFLALFLLNSCYLLYQISNQDQTKKWKKIVIWNDFFHSREVWRSIFKRMIEGRCPESRCTVTLNREEIFGADAVLFHGYNLQFKKLAPRKFKKHIFPLPSRMQNYDKIFIFYSMEAPLRLQNLYLSTLDNYFNWTMTYRKDSDVVEPFGTVTPRLFRRSTSRVNFVTKEELKKKRTAIWIASHCPKKSLARSLFVEALQEFVDVDVFGKCGKECDKYIGTQMYGQAIGNGTCEGLVPGYSFYLALENSVCQDYVTEKIFKAWQLGIVPVVFGGANYSAFAPPMSYIDSQDFDSVMELANYLKLVSDDPVLYNKYLEWQDYYDIEIGSPYDPMICGLCQKLYDNEIYGTTKTYKSISDWFVRGSKCVERFHMKVRPEDEKDEAISSKVIHKGQKQVTEAAKYNHS